VATANRGTEYAIVPHPPRGVSTVSREIQGRATASHCDAYRQKPISPWARVRTFMPEGMSQPPLNSKPKAAAAAGSNEQFPHPSEWPPPL